MINTLLLSSVQTTTFHTSSSTGISAFFGGGSFRINSAGSINFTLNYTPGIPVSTSVKFFLIVFIISI